MATPALEVLPAIDTADLNNGRWRYERHRLVCQNRRLAGEDCHSIGRQSGQPTKGRNMATGEGDRSCGMPARTSARAGRILSRAFKIGVDPRF
jgi:hypothetical protein